MAIATVFRAARGYIDTGDDLAPGCTCGKHRAKLTTPDITPEELAERRRGIERARKQLEAEERSRPRLNAVQRRVANEVAADYKYAAENPPPDPYKAGLEELRRRNEIKEARR